MKVIEPLLLVVSSPVSHRPDRMPDSPDVLVWGSPSRFVHVTVVPTVIVRFSSWKPWLLEETPVAVVVGGARIMAVPEGDVERSTEDGKASSVHFLHFPFTEAQIAAFRDPATKVLLEIAHDHYGHLGIIPPETRAILGKDFD